MSAAVFSEDDVEVGADVVVGDSLGIDARFGEGAGEDGDEGLGD
jgi:hypothetical protein